MKIFLPPPQHWYSNPQNSNWSQNIRPPTVPYYSPEPKLLQPFSEWVQKDHRLPAPQDTTKHNNHRYKHQSKPERTQKEPKSETKKCPTFVPLQAQKKSRHVTAKQAVSRGSENQSAKDNPKSTVQHKEKELPAKVFFFKYYFFNLKHL